MKFSSEDLMKAMGLQVGDKLLLNNNDIYIVDETGILHSDIKMGYYHESYLSEIIDVEDYEILPRPKRVGDLKCGTKGKDGQNTCGDCPVRIICGHYTCRDELGAGDSLYEYLETYKTKIKEEYEDEDYNEFDQEIYDLLKARLDKEVE